jgi:hypothetical protein
LDDIAEGELKEGIKEETGLGFLRTADPSNNGGESKEALLEFKMEFTDQKLPSADIRNIQTLKTAKSLSLKDCRERCIRCYQIPLSRAGAIPTPPIQGKS